jgi:hypothetical protein
MKRTRLSPMRAISLYEHKLRGQHTNAQLAALFHIKQTSLYKALRRGKKLYEEGAPPKKPRKTRVDVVNAALRRSQEPAPWVVTYCESDGLEADQLHDLDQALRLVASLHGRGYGNVGLWQRVPYEVRATINRRAK